MSPFLKNTDKISNSSNMLCILLKNKEFRVSKRIAKSYCSILIIRLNHGFTWRQGNINLSVFINEIFGDKYGT